MIVTTAAVREYMDLNSVSSSSRYSDSTLGSNIRAAQGMLERTTGRIFESITATKKFTTNGAAFIAIPGLRTASSIQLQSTALVGDETYYLIPDSQQTGVHTGIQFRAFQTSGTNPYWYKSNPEWFDRNLDSPWYQYAGARTSLPNDLVIAGDWGWTDAQMPEPVRHAVKVLAAYYTKRPDAILSGGITTPDGNTFDLSGLPVEVQAFVPEWRVGPSVVSVVGL